MLPEEKLIKILKWIKGNPWGEQLIAYIRNM